ncbi:MAG: DedA family protein [Bacteroidales bacterium]|nr:DedA family protein [Bacteroidales bacterium]
MELLSQLGLIGLFLGCFLAATVIPFSSDFLMVGVLIAGFNPVLSIIVATAGNWLGGLTSYYIGFIGKWDWIEKWFKVKEETLLKQKHNIDKYGSLLAFLTWLPIIGDVFAVTLGFYKVNFTKSAIFMLIGKGARFAFWALLYHYFGEHVLDFKFL